MHRVRRTHTGARNAPGPPLDPEKLLASAINALDITRAKQPTTATKTRTHPRCLSRPERIPGPRPSQRSSSRYCMQKGVSGNDPRPFLSNCSTVRHRAWDHRLPCALWRSDSRSRRSAIHKERATRATHAHRNVEDPRAESSHSDLRGHIARGTILRLQPAITDCATPALPGQQAFVVFTPSPVAVRRTLDTPGRKTCCCQALAPDTDAVQLPCGSVPHDKGKLARAL